MVTLLAEVIPEQQLVVATCALEVQSGATASGRYKLRIALIERRILEQ